MKSTKQLNI